MAGYDGYSKSNNAVRAESEGKLTLSQVKKTYKLETETIKNFLTPCEWHHTSNWYNETNYYDPVDIEEVLNEKQNEVHTFNQLIKEQNKSIEFFENCEVHYIEWGGTRSRPIPYEKTLEHVNLSKKGKTYTITDQNGEVVLTKREGTNGFYFYTEEQLLRMQKEKEYRLSLEEKCINLLKDRMFSVYNYFDKNNEEVLSGNFFINKIGDFETCFLKRFIENMESIGRGRFDIEYLVIDTTIDPDYEKIEPKLLVENELRNSGLSYNYN